jgi:antiviral helicase SKI2
MADSLASAMQNLRLTAKDLDPNLMQTQLETPIAEGEGASSGPGPRKQAHQSGKELLAELEAEFLTPSSKFTPSWLNQLQQ